MKFYFRNFGAEWTDIVEVLSYYTLNNFYLSKLDKLKCFWSSNLKS